MAPTFIFIRHGEAEHNVAYHTEGVSAFSKELYRDALLTTKGVEQARTAAAQIIEKVGMDFLDIWCSPLSRCIQTGEELFEELNCCDLYLHDNLLECQGGNNLCNERRTKKEIKKLHGAWKTTYIAENGPVWIEYENPYSLRTRMLMFVLFLAHLYKDNTDKEYVLVVSHKDAIAALTGKHLTNAEFLVMKMDEILKED